MVPRTFSPTVGAVFVVSYSHHAAYHAAGRHLDHHGPAGGGIATRRLAHTRAAEMCTPCSNLKQCYAFSRCDPAAAQSPPNNARSETVVSRKRKQRLVFRRVRDAVERFLMRPWDASVTAQRVGRRFVQSSHAITGRQTANPWHLQTLRRRVAWRSTCTARYGLRDERVNSSRCGFAITRSSMLAHLRPLSHSQTVFSDRVLPACCVPVMWVVAHIAQFNETRIA